MQKYFMLMAVFFLFSFTHPIHVSVCDIEYDHKRKAIEITQRIFLDDLEKAIRNMEGAPHLDITNPDNGKSTDEMVRAYLSEHLKITINGTTRDHNYLGHEIEGEALYAYMEIDKIKDLQSIDVFSDILTYEYEDQVNLIHIEVAGKIRSMKLTGKDKRDTFKYN